MFELFQAVADRDDHQSFCLVTAEGVCLVSVNLGWEGQERAMRRLSRCILLARKSVRLDHCLD